MKIISRSRSPNSYSIKENPAKFHDFEKGKSLLGSSSSHAGLGTTEKETIIRRTTYINRDPRRNRNLNLPCTFFSSGSCNLGEDCRFSHLVKACAGLEGRSENKILSDKDTTTAWYVDKSLEHGFEMRNIIDKDPEDESKNLEVEAKKPQENCPLERMKIFNDDARAMCVFKYQLVQFVKDLLTPTWKKGQISKEVYKHIARKVTDKVIASIEGPYIPRTKRKIDQYLSLSKPKIAKLVQVICFPCISDYYSYYL